MFRAVKVFMMARVVQVVQTVPVEWSGLPPWMICFQKIYGFHALNHQIIEKS